MEAPPERDVYGEAPPSLLLGLTVLAGALAVVLFVLGHWILGLVVLVACLLLATAFVTTSRRASRQLRNARGHAGYVAMSLATWSHAGRRAMGLLAYERRLHRQRAAAIQTLGEAVYRNDEATAALARQQVASLDEHLLETVRARTEALGSASRRVGEERLASQATETHSADELP